jgi:hypothetical protein
VLGYQPQQTTIIIVMYAPVEEWIGCWNMVKKLDVLFSIRGSQAFSIPYIHTQIITLFYVVIKLVTLLKQPF